VRPSNGHEGGPRAGGGPAAHTAGGGAAALDTADSGGVPPSTTSAARRGLSSPAQPPTSASSAACAASAAADAKRKREATYEELVRQTIRHAEKDLCKGLEGLSEPHRHAAGTSATSALPEALRTSLQAMPELLERALNKGWVPRCREVLGEQARAEVGKLGPEELIDDAPIARLLPTLRAASQKPLQKQAVYDAAAHGFKLDQVLEEAVDGLRQAYDRSFHEAQRRRLT